MSRELRDASDPQSWLRRARSNLIRARAGRADPEVLYDDLCFDAQQAAEKAAKAVLVSLGIEFPKTHVLGRLFDLAANGGGSVPSEVREAEVLTDYATNTRYPGGGEDVEETEYQEAVVLAGHVMDWAEREVTRNAPPAAPDDCEEGPGLG